MSQRLTDCEVELLKHFHRNMSVDGSTRMMLNSIQSSWDWNRFPATEVNSALSSLERQSYITPVNGREGRGQGFYEITQSGIALFPLI